MKSIKNRNRNKKPLIIVVAVLVIIGATAGAVFYKINQDTTQKHDAQTSNKQRADQVKRDAKKNDNKEGLPSNSESKTSDQVPTSTTKSISIASTSQSNGKVEAIAQASDDGTCVFLYTSEGDKPVTTQSTTNSKTCTSSVPEVQFAKLGLWKLTVTLYVSNEKAEATKDVTIN